MLIVSTRPFAQKIRTLLSSEVLNGKVMEITEIEYRSKAPVDTLIKQIILYNLNGLTIERRLKLKYGGQRYYKYQTKLDSTGKKVETTCSELNNNLSMKYDDNGNVVEFKCVSNNGNLKFKDLNKYNRKNNRIEDNYYDAKDSLEIKRVYKYDKKNNLVEEDNYRPSKTLNYKIYYHYVDFDEAGNWTKRVFSGKFIVGNIISEHTVERKITYYK